MGSNLGYPLLLFRITLGRNGLRILSYLLPYGNPSRCVWHASFCSENKIIRDIHFIVSNSMNCTWGWRGGTWRAGCGQPFPARWAGTVRIWGQPLVPRLGLPLSHCSVMYPVLVHFHSKGLVSPTLDSGSRFLHSPLLPCHPTFEWIFHPRMWFFVMRN